MGVLILIVVIGVVGTVVSRDRRLTQIANGGTVPPEVGGTPWNEALGIYLCGSFAPNITIAKDPFGIDTQSDGVIHIAPTDKSVAGENATLGKFASAVVMTLNAAEIQLPGGKLYQNGDNCEGGKGQIYVKMFAYPGAPSGTLLNQDPRTVKLEDQAMLTIAFVPPSLKNKIPAPPSAVQTNLKNLATTTTTSSTTTPAASTTTAAGSSTTAAATSTTAAASTTTASGSG
ncbi:MAG: hypothetical protein ACRDYC_11940 [Acidimicrobiales bacterium]